MLDQLVKSFSTTKAIQETNSTGIYYLDSSSLKILSILEEVKPKHHQHRKYDEEK